MLEALLNNTVCFKQNVQSNGTMASHTRRKKNIIPYSVQSLIFYGCGCGGSGGVWIGGEDEGVISCVLKLNP
jgi:hypothetical protein